MRLEERIRKETESLRASGNYRVIRHMERCGRYMTGFRESPASRESRTGSPDVPVRMLNLSSNDYLGLANDASLREAFLATAEARNSLLSSSSSRLLTGNFPEYDTFEAQLAEDYGKSALLLNCGYHANSGILPALATEKTLILADKLVHASLIDGIRLCLGKFIRFRHNDFDGLARLMDKYCGEFDTVFVVVESIYSMDGDTSDLARLTELKREYGKRCDVILYVDEAHGVGVRGRRGLGLAEECGCLGDIDILVGTLGKALASEGAFVICDSGIRDYLINRMRPFIFTTALPPFNIAWSRFVWEKMKGMNEAREHLLQLSERLGRAVESLSKAGKEAEKRESLRTQIIPLLIGESDAAMQLAGNLQKKGFFVLPVRPPTVPQGTARLRFSLTADMTFGEIDSLIGALEA